MPGPQPAVPVHLGLGSNLGDRAAHLRGALRDLSAHGVRIEAASRIFAGPYVGSGPPQPEYWNAVVRVTTSLPPLALWRLARDIERRHGREPGSHSRPRPLDIDVLYYAGWRLRSVELVIPHPRILERRFVLEPLADLGDAARIPDFERHLARLRDRQPLRALPESLLEVEGAVAAN